MPTTPNKKNRNIILRMHPLQRILLGLFFVVITYLCVYNFHLDWVITVPMLWISFALTFLITSTIVFFKLPVTEIVHKANQEDGSRTFVFVSILTSSFVCLLTVLLLMLSDKMHTREFLAVIVAILGMMVSWAMVHTIFTFHYAHMYYFDSKEKKSNDTPLNFPGNMKPDYLDFAYFSFVIGMTFQVSDVEITSPRIRRTVLFHGLLSFILNTFVVALTINLIAGLTH